MLIDGCWFPDLFDKQQRILEMCRRQDGLRKYVLASGARWAGKTIGCLNAIVDHCWNTENASVSITVPTITVGSDSGVWTLLTDTIIPEWIAGDFGLDWAPKGTPRQSGHTKKLYCVIINKFGGRSRIELNSLKDERDVETDFKARNFTMIYVSEASFLKHRKTYLTLIQCFRVKGVAEEKYVLLLDTNPSDEGEDSWLYKEWYVFRAQDPERIENKDELPRQKYLKLIEFFPDDNPYLNEEKKASIRSEFASDPDLYARYWLAQWKKAKTGALFGDVFKPALHVIGETSTLDTEILVPENDCMELMTGWDFGPANPAVVFCEKFFCEFPADKPGDPPVERPCFKFFDELIFIGETELSLGEFTCQACEHMDMWEKVIGRPIRWTHYSDRSAFDVRESISNIYQYQEVYAASEERIALVAVDKRPGTVPQSIRLWRKMLLQQRLIFSAAMCPRLVEMNQSLCAGTNGQPIAKNTVHKHPFDAARYIIMRECWQELQDTIIVLRNAKREPQKVISIAL